MQQIVNAFNALVQTIAGAMPFEAALGLTWLLLLVVVIWLIEGLNWMTGHRLNALAIRPRTFTGLVGVLFAPLLHGSFAHVAANSVPLLVLGTLVCFSDFDNLLIVTLLSWVFGGLGTWLLGGSNSRHLGSSGLVFGYLGFLLAFALLQQSALAIALAAIALLAYGGILWGLTPFRPGRSWQAHLAGITCGIATAWLLPQLFGV